MNDQQPPEIEIFDQNGELLFKTPELELTQADIDFVIGKVREVNKTAFKDLGLQDWGAGMPTSSQSLPINLGALRELAALEMAALKWGTAEVYDGEGK